MKIYKVGGAVRDELLGETPKDVDYVVVGATPEMMLAKGFKQVGADFPVFLDEHGTEYALARTERKSGHGYNGFVTDHSAKVTLKEDLRRRDLTINAMAMDDEGNIIDPYNGQQHLNKKILKHVSEAFAEDPVRVLRLARFRARYGEEWSIDPETKLLCSKMADSGELQHLTRERVLLEFEKAFTEKYTWLFFETLADLGALEIVFPELGLRRHVFRILIESGTTSPKMKYANLTMGMMRTAETFEKRLNVSNEWRKYSKMWRHEWNAGVHPIDQLYKMDAYRQEDLVNEILRDYFIAYDEESPLCFPFHSTKEIGFKDLTPAQQKRLKGPEIAEAIKNHRKEVWDRNE